MEETIEIKHREDGHRGAFYFERNGEQLAEMTYGRKTDTLINIDHTEVSDTLRGLGIGRKMLDALVTWARNGGIKVKATCPYALAQFRKDASIQDVFVEA